MAEDDERRVGSQPFTTVALCRRDDRAASPIHRRPVGGEYRERKITFDGVADLVLALRIDEDRTFSSRKAADLPF